MAGQRREPGMRWNDLQVGDRLLQVGDVDLKGAGYIAFEGSCADPRGRWRDRRT
ncbi:MAG: hypothetical protein O7G30_15405 [Proteobacteria bacterium]|nr:hypothetical protein [Pseudomonadota bacterium]